MAPMKAMKAMKAMKTMKAMAAKKGAKAMSKGTLAGELAAKADLKKSDISKLLDALTEVGTKEEAWSARI